MRSFIAVSVLLLMGSFADAHNVGNGVLNRLFNVGNNNHNRGQQQFNRFFNQGHSHHGQAQFFNGGYVNRNFFPGYGAGYSVGASFAPQCYVPPQVPVYYQQYQPPVVVQQQQPQYYLAPQPVFVPSYAPACGVGYGQGGCGVGAARLFGY